MILLSNSWALANAGGNSSGGGDAVRLDIISIREFIYGSCAYWDSLKKTEVDPQQLKNKISEVGTAEKIKIQDIVTLEDGVPRSGKNTPALSEITFSRTFWLETNDDTIRKIGFVLHEYLGLMGIEKTDDYHASHAVVNELRLAHLLHRLEYKIFTSNLRQGLPKENNTGRETSSPSNCPNLTGVWRFKSKRDDWNGGVGHLFKQDGCKSLAQRDIIFEDRSIKYSYSEFQATADTSFIGDGQHTRYENNVRNLDSAVDFPVTYSAEFKNGKFIETQFLPNNQTCKNVRKEWALKSKDVLVEDDFTSCDDGRKLHGTYTYFRAEK